MAYEIRNDNIEHFMNVQLKKPYALKWEKLMVEMDIHREPLVYEPIGKFGTNNN